MKQKSLNIFNKQKSIKQIILILRVYVKLYSFKCLISNTSVSSVKLDIFYMNGGTCQNA